MKSHSIHYPPFRLHVMMILAALALMAGLQPLSAGTSGRKLLNLDISADRKTGTVKVPAGYGEVVLQRFDRKGGWRKVTAKKADSKVVKFKLSDKSADIRWRAIGRFDGGKAPRSKFPAAFYAGGNSFKPTKSTSLPGVGILSDRSLSVMDLAEPVPSVDAAVEADIWKTDGNTIYFFNQLRGLQVLDVSNPADPRLTASLRLPALGEDLYLLPGSGSVRHLVLLTRRTTEDGNENTRIHLVKVSGSSAKILFQQDVSGSLADSRLVGNRLILATTEWTFGAFGVDGVEEDGTTTWLSQWIIPTDSAPQSAGQFEIEGSNPIIAAGEGWLAVAVNPQDDWSVSDVSVFAVDKAGLIRLTSKPIRTAGSIADQFKIQWAGNVLTTISESNKDEWDWSPVTVLENFRVSGAGSVQAAAAKSSGPLLGSLELADGESLFATRFAGNKAYIVTFLQTDPLWIVDLTDPAKPVVAGHIEVPGWSSHLAPIGDKLFAVGWEDDSLTASLFDVADSAAPKLLRRLKLGGAGGYSEASWDEQALKVLPEDGLALIPITSYDSGTGVTSPSVRLIDIDLKAGDLIERGAIGHEFDARRSDLIGSTVFSISQRVLVGAGIADRDKPEVLSEVALAWPVDRILDAGKHLLHIEDGSSWMSGRATLRVSPADSTEAVIAETDLGEGTVRAAALRGEKLYVLRELASKQPYWYWSPVIGKLGGKAVLDIYDASVLPALSPLGSVSVNLKHGQSVSQTGLLWPQENRPVVLIDGILTAFRDFPIIVGPIIRDLPVLTMPVVTLEESAKQAISPGIGISIVDRFPIKRPSLSTRILVFDTANAAEPEAEAPVAIGTNESTQNGTVAASDGLVVVGCRDWKNEATGNDFGQAALDSVRVIEVPASGAPVVRPVIDLPGELFAVTDLDSRGFLAFTRSYEKSEEPAYKVSASDGYDAFEVASLDGKASSAATAGGRRLFIAEAGGVQRHVLNDDGTFTIENRWDVGWTPQALRFTDGTVLGMKWNALFAADTDEATVSKWRFPTWSPEFEDVSIADDGDVLAPFGEYGAERLDR